MRYEEYININIRITIHGNQPYNTNQFFSWQQTSSKRIKPTLNQAPGLLTNKYTFLQFLAICHKLSNLDTVLKDYFFCFLLLELSEKNSNIYIVHVSVSNKHSHTQKIQK